MKQNWINFQTGAVFLGALAVTQFLGINTAAQAAETVVVRFGLFTESISLAELQKTAETGEFPDNLHMYTKRLSEQQRGFLLGALKMKIPINVVTISKLLNTQIATTILSDLSTVFRREDNAGVQALRAGLVLGTNPEKGLSLLSFIAAYPSQQLDIDLGQGLRFAKSLNTGFWRTQQFMVGISSLLNNSQKPQISLAFNPMQPGSETRQILNLNLTDEKRQRMIPVDIYYSKGISVEKPVIVFTHGLGSVRTELRYLAEHLASYGYVVVALEHPGSNVTNTSLAMQGKSRLVKPQEFLERPKDISFVLDELEKLNQIADNPLRGKLATDKVMIVGYSFGGATALSIAGAELQLKTLKKRCQENLAISSLGETIQCVAQELPENNYQLGDSRIKSAIAFSPTTSLMFGETGLTKLKIPTLILAQSADKTTPALTEQIAGFAKMLNPKWFVGIVGGTHLSVKDPSATLDQKDKPNTPLTGGEVVGEQAADIRQYVKALTLAFAAQQSPDAKKYEPFLTSDYALFASTKVFPIRLIREIPADAMEIVKEFIRE